MTGQGHALPSIENIRDAIQAANDRNSRRTPRGIEACFLLSSC
jgi:hypothetical protein